MELSRIATFMKGGPLKKDSRAAYFEKPAKDFTKAGKYIRRIPKSGGGYRYVYKPEKGKGEGVSQGEKPPIQGARKVSSSGVWQKGKEYYVSKETWEKTHSDYKGIGTGFFAIPKGQKTMMGMDEKGITSLFSVNVIDGDSKKKSSGLKKTIEKSTQENMIDGADGPIKGDLDFISQGMLGKAQSKRRKLAGLDSTMQAELGVPL